MAMVRCNNIEFRKNLSHLFRVLVADRERMLEVKESKCKNRMAVVH
jgi:hypothetical protein